MKKKHFSIDQFFFALVYNIGAEWAISSGTNVGDSAS